MSVSNPHDLIVHSDFLFSNKAVADGAVSSYVSPLVTSRTSKYTYGVECIKTYNPSLSDHRDRQHTQFTVPSGDAVLPNGFKSILQKVCIGQQSVTVFIQFPDRVSKCRSSKHLGTLSLRREPLALR